LPQNCSAVELPSAESQLAFGAATTRTSRPPQAQAPQTYGSPNSRRPMRSAANAARPNAASDGFAHRTSQPRPPVLRAASASLAPSVDRAGRPLSAAAKPIQHHDCDRQAANGIQRRYVPPRQFGRRMPRPSGQVKPRSTKRSPNHEGQPELRERRVRTRLRFALMRRPCREFRLYRRCRSVSRSKLTNRPKVILQRLVQPLIDGKAAIIQLRGGLVARRAIDNADRG
jgi:hypothetical protein